ncbi:hypothetical protein NSQ59_27300 [Margalitia sp. FSL K6-0131]|uniref:hypothetical protein n=1 Tax=Margalitia sp. FSL K6-0131 TaxID=2954604 RepID=UPI0030F75288
MKNYLKEKVQFIKEVARLSKLTMKNEKGAATVLESIGMILLGLIILGGLALALNPQARTIITNFITSLTDTFTNITTL